MALPREANPPARAAAGWLHSLFIDGEGRVSSCGKAESWTPGLLGLGEGVTRLNTPTLLPSSPGAERAESVSAGSAHSLVLTADGAVWSWGDAHSGNLGLGDSQSQWQPRKVVGFESQRVVAVSAGAAHSLALTADGAAWSWGYGHDGRLGHGDQQDQLLPKKIEAFAGQCVIAVSAGGMYSLAITAGGAVWSWGVGQFEMLGHGDLQWQLLPKKVEAFAGRRVVAVSAGYEHSLALADDGAVCSWGDGGYGKLGHGDEQGQPLPKKVEAFAGQRVDTVSAGPVHSLAITADGSVWSWGYGGEGQLGHGDEHGQPLPKKVAELAGQRVVAVSAGRAHSIALTADGAFFTWGCVGYGEDVSNQLLPKKVEAWASEPPSSAPGS